MAPWDMSVSHNKPSGFHKLLIIVRSIADHSALSKIRWDETRGDNVLFLCRVHSFIHMQCGHLRSWLRFYLVLAVCVSAFQITPLDPTYFIQLFFCNRHESAYRKWDTIYTVNWRILNNTKIMKIKWRHGLKDGKFTSSLLTANFWIILHKVIFRDLYLICCCVES